MCVVVFQISIYPLQVFSHLQKQAEAAQEASKTFNQIMSVLSFEKITFNGKG